MPEEVEIETHELQETLDELHEERLELEEEREQEHERAKEQHEREKKDSAWTRYVAVSTALLAVFAAIGALQSGGLINEAMIAQIRAADLWSEYQADKQKGEIFMTEAYALLDRGVVPAPKPKKNALVDTAAEAPAAGEAKPEKDMYAPDWQPSTPSLRLRNYMTQADKELKKTTALREEAQKLEEESHEMMERHHHFAWSVALIQVAIALSAIAALTRMRSVWACSLMIGLVGIVLFMMGVHLG